ncbi:MAG: thiamine-phosphate kinase [bacterium]
MNLRRLGEFGLITKLQSRLQYRSPQIVAGIGDDCAVYRGKPGKYQIISSDCLVEKVHFDLSTTSPEQLGRKVLAVNLSDIAAMGGAPWLALISTAIPKTFPVKFMERFYDGLNQISGQYQIEIAGGDTVCSPKHFYINITILGEANKRRFFTRAGAREGDKIFVTGSLGDAALGLKLLQSRKTWAGPRAAQQLLIRKQLDPVPRICESRLLVKSKAEITAMIDVSDGLAQDLSHICRASGTGAILWEESLPKSSAFEKICFLNSIAPRKLVLTGGEDYELLFTLKPESVKYLTGRFKKIGKDLTLIGEITRNRGKTILVKKNGRREVLRKLMGFNHFAT